MTTKTTGSRCHSTQLNSTQLNSTQLNSTQLNSTQLNENGFSIIEVLIAVCIMGILAMGMATMFSQQQTEMKALSEKFDVQSLQHSVLTMLQNQTTCTANFTVAPVDISDATTAIPSVNSINLLELHVGPTVVTPLIAKKDQPLPGKAPGQMVVSSIEIKNIVRTGNLNEYQGALVISFYPTSMVRSLRPISINQIFTIVPPATTAVVANCGNSLPLTFSTVCAHGWAGANTFACCQMNVQNGSTICKEGATTYPSATWVSAGSPFAAGPLGIYELTCAGGSGGYNFLTCCRVNRINGVTSCMELAAFPSTVWSPLAAGNPF